MTTEIERCTCRKPDPAYVERSGYGSDGARLNEVAHYAGLVVCGECLGEITDYDGRVMRINLSSVIARRDELKKKQS
jgi:hypothetical protein